MYIAYDIFIYIRMILCFIKFLAGNTLIKYVYCLNDCGKITLRI